MNNVRPLRIIPPAQVFHVNLDGFKRGLGLLNLDLKSAMGQQKGTPVVKKNFQCANSIHGKNAGKSYFLSRMIK
jgi:hypothetical protein